MRSKNILSVAAFVLAFAASAAFASLFITKTPIESNFVLTGNYKTTSCFKERNRSASAANKITALISEDHNNGSDRDGERFTAADINPPFTSARFPEYAASVKRYVDKSSSMRVEDLPADFQSEWREHMTAWREYSDFLNQMKKSANRKYFSDEELENTDDFHSREINRTWYAVLQSGRSYGADVY